MEILHGKVADIRTYKDVYVGESSGWVDFTTTFQVDQNKVRFRNSLYSPSGDTITAGDVVVFAGRFGSDGIFEAHSFRNLTSGVSENVRGITDCLIFSLIGAAICFFLLWLCYYFNDTILYALSLLPLVLFLLGSIQQFRLSRKIAEAEALLKKWVTTSP